MHGLAHVKRLLQSAYWLMERYPADEPTVVLGAYLHGIADKWPDAVVSELTKLGFSSSERQRILKAAQESQKEACPELLEGKILHDAHLIEGGPTFLLVKALVTGTERGQRLDETIDVVERELLGRFSCCFPEAQAIYVQKERYAIEAINSLKEHLVL